MSLWEQAWPIWTPGAWLAIFMQEITKHCYILNIQAVGLMVLDFFPFIVNRILAPRAWPA